jgi:uncharacterized HAD superfamily protein
MSFPPGWAIALNFRTVADLNATIVRNLQRIPEDVDVVVGVPRSGLMAAALVALSRNLPLADMTGFSEGRLLGAGTTRGHKGLKKPFSDLRHVLMVDDSFYTGAAMERARTTLTAAQPDKHYTFCAIYGVPEAANKLDILLEIVPMPRIFQWNLMHHSALAKACVDIDGVLCVDPTEAENDDGPAYLRFLAEAVPLHKATQRIGTLVTSRLEKYRPQTEAWLAEQHIDYDRLVMLDLPDMATRRRLGNHGEFKGKFYRDSAAILFIESDLGQAETIVRLSGKPVICMDGPIILTPDLLSVRGALQRAHTFRQRQFARAKMVVRRLIGEKAYNRIKAMRRTP